MDEQNSYRIEDMIGIINEVLESGGEFRFYPRGTSMLPLLRQGRDSITLVSPPEKLNKYDIPLYQRDNGQYVLHRVIKTHGCVYTMCGDNQTEFEIGVEPRQIRGVVTAIWRGEKRIDVDNFWYRLYCRLWCVMPIRKTCRFIRRVLGKIARALHIKK